MVCIASTLNVGVGSAVLGAQALISKLSMNRAVIKTDIFDFIQIPFLLNMEISSQEFAMIDSYCADFPLAGTDGIGKRLSLDREG
jgi:hypothetical protein